MKASAKKALARYWPAYLASLALLPLFSYELVEQIQKPKNEETISIFIGSISSDASAAKKMLNENKPDYLLEINIYSYSYLESAFATYYSASGKEGADLIILPESKIVDVTVFSYYSPLDEAHSSSDDYVIEDNGKHYGKLLRKKGEDFSWLSLSDESHDENFYAFFGKGSLHAGSVNGNGRETSFFFLSLLQNKKQ